MRPWALALSTQGVNRVGAEAEHQVLTSRGGTSAGPDSLATEVGVPARTITRILRSHDVPRLFECDQVTGEKPGIKTKALSRDDAYAGWRLRSPACELTVTP